MCDELKLRSGIYMFRSSHELAGFASDTKEMNLGAELKNLMSSDEDKPSDETFEQTQYVNQWRFRSLYNKTFNCEYFYNAGHLNGEELQRQFLHIVRCLEFVGVMVLGLCSDAGGSNARLFKLLREEPAQSGSWLDELSVSVKNPSDPSRRIA